jgi:hypothetical protein
MPSLSSEYLSDSRAFMILFQIFSLSLLPPPQSPVRCRVTRILLRKIVPRNAGLQDIEDRVDGSSAIRSRLALLGARLGEGEEWLDVPPLLVRQRSELHMIGKKRTTKERMSKKIEEMVNEVLRYPCEQAKSLSLWSPHRVSY